MLGRFKKSFIKYCGERNRKDFMNSLDKYIKNIPAKRSDMDVVSMSGKKYFADQLFSLLSFYYHAGTPVSWTIYDDGTYGKKELDIFSKIPALKVKQIGASVYDKHTSRYPTLKKMLLLQQIVPERTTMYTDSDVLFFPNFQAGIAAYKFRNCYLVDENTGYFDEFIPADISREHPLNLGVLILNSVPDWRIAFDYIENRINNNELAYWSDQTATHIMAKKENFTALTDTVFVTGGRDAFSLADAFDYKKIALRHFVGPIRHKMWQRNPKKILAL